MKPLKGAGKIAKGVFYMGNRVADVASRMMRMGKYIDGSPHYPHSNAEDWEKGKQMIKDGFYEIKEEKEW